MASFLALVNTCFTYSRVNSCGHLSHFHFVLSKRRNRKIINCSDKPIPPTNDSLFAVVRAQSRGAIGAPHRAKVGAQLGWIFTAGARTQEVLPLAQMRTPLERALKRRNHCSFVYSARENINNRNTYKQTSGVVEEHHLAFHDRNRGVHPQVGLTVNGNERVRHTIVGHEGCPRVQPADKAVLLDALVGSVATNFKCVYVKHATAVLNQVFIYGHFFAFTVPNPVKCSVLKQRFNDILA